MIVGRGVDACKDGEQLPFRAIARSQLTSCRHHSDVDISIMTRLDQDQRACHVALNRLELVVFTPIHIGPSSLPSAVDNMRRLHLIKYTPDFALIVHSDIRGMHVVVLAMQQGFEVSSNPAFRTPNEESVR